MVEKLIAQTIAEIAARERTQAVEEGDYVWALICAVLEQRAREAAALRP